MPFRARLLVLVLALSGAAFAAEPPQLLLHVSFDGTVEPAFSAFPSLHTVCVQARYAPHKDGQAVAIGSDRFPAPLQYRAPRLLNKERGSIELRYQPLWDPTTLSEQRGSRVLLTDQAGRGETARFRLSIERDQLLFGWPGNPPTLIATPVGSWKKGQWHHILFTWDSADGVALFLDGVKIQNRLVQWSLSPSDTLLVGANHLGRESADGLIDELRMYDRPLTADEAEVSALAPVASREAPPVVVPAPPKQDPPKPAEPNLTFHCTFDNTVEAQKAEGAGSPVLSKGAAYEQGLLGKALVAREGLSLAYATDKNLSKERGTLMLWARALADAPAEQRVLVADARDPGSDPLQASNGFGLWVEGRGATVMRFGIRPAAASMGLPRWDDGLWHHLAVTWEHGRSLQIYVNGQLAISRFEEGATWQTTPSPRLCIGSLDGTGPAHALLDDLRVYDAPLDAMQIAAEARKCVEPMHLELRPSLCERGQACELVARLFPRGEKPLRSELTWRVTGPDGKEVATLRQPVEIAPGKWIEARIPLSADALSTEGPYQVAPTLPGKTGLPGADLLVVAPIPRESPADGDVQPSIKLQHVGTIDPSAVSNAPEKFARSGPSRVLQSGQVRYHEAGPNQGDRIAFRFVLPDAGHPYMALLSYPDNAARSAGIVMSTPRMPTSYDVATGYLRGDESPTMQIVNHPIYFWPRERQGALILRTLRAGRPAAVARIAFYRVRGSLPTSSVREPADGGRAIGLQWEIPIVPAQFGSLGAHPTHVYRSFLRLTDYLRFTGQNLLVYPIVASRGPVYGSEQEGFLGGPAAYGHTPGWLDYVLALCERRSLRFLPEIRFHDSHALRSGKGGQEDGTATTRMALWDDSPSARPTGETPLYSPTHPDFQAALLGYVDEFLARHGRSPALSGMAIHLGQAQSGWFGSIQCGYGDATIAQFEQDTGIRVPVDASSPARFSRRARWLLEKQYEAWVAWRCEVVHALHTKVAERLRQANGKLKLYLTVATPVGTASLPLFGSQAVSAERPVEQLLREAGLDLAAYAPMPNIVVRRVLYPTDAACLLYRYGQQRGELRGSEAARDVAYLAESNRPFRSAHGVAVASTYHPFESDSRAAGPLPGFWWSPVTRRMTQPTPAGRTFLEPYAHALAALDATALSAGHSALATMGHEPEVHLFARAFRALPARPFEDIAGLSDPVCGRQLRDGGSHFVYFVNRTDSPATLAVAFAGEGVKLLDLATLQTLDLPAVKDRELPAAMPQGFVSEHSLPAEPGPLPDLEKTQAVSGSLLERTLAAYELVSYGVVGGDARIAYASARTEQDTRMALAQRIASARALVAAAKGEEAAVAAARQTLSLIERAWSKHEVHRVQLLLDSSPLARLR